MMRKRILIIGYGINESRKEAISLNANGLVRSLRDLGMRAEILNIGYESPKGVYFGKSMRDALSHRSQIIEKIKQYILDNKITHITDVFALPGASVLFILPLKRMCPDVKFIKELQNDSGYSRKFQTESLIRFFLNSEKYLQKVLVSFDCIFSRNLNLAKKRKLIYLPPKLKIYKKRNFKKGSTLRLCYLGHPLKKKGINRFPEVIKILPKELKKIVEFNFAFSNLGDPAKVRKEFFGLARKSGVVVSFQSIVAPEEFFRGNDVYILPINDEFGAASTPNTVLEAMEAGALVLVSKIKSLDGVIKNRENGLYMSSPKAEEILKGIEFAVGNPDQVKDMVNNARKFIEDNYSREKVVKVLKEIYV